MEENRQGLQPLHNSFHVLMCERQRGESKASDTQISILKCDLTCTEGIG